MKRDDVRDALGIGMKVPTSIGVVTVNRMSVRDVIGTVDTVISIAMKTYREMRENSRDLSALNSLGSDERERTAIQAIVALSQSAAADFLRLLEPSTSRKAAELEALDAEEFLDVLLAFLEMHEGAIARFFELRARVQAIAQKARAGTRKSSTSSSAPGGASTMSSRSITSKSSDTSEQHENGSSEKKSETSSDSTRETRKTSPRRSGGKSEG